MEKARMYRPRAHRTQVSDVVVSEPPGQYIALEFFRNWL